MKIKIFWIVLAIIIFFILKRNKVFEGFFLWNIPTRGLRPIYDIRGYPWSTNDYYFLHNGAVFNKKYIDTSKFTNLGLPFYDYYPYYFNGMIYNANGSYTYDQFMKSYGNIPILYPISYDAIDWRGLYNNGIIKSI